MRHIITRPSVVMNDDEWNHYLLKGYEWAQDLEV